MEKYFAFMKNEQGKEAVATGWKYDAISKWIAFHEERGYRLIKRG